MDHEEFQEHCPTDAELQDDLVRQLWYTFLHENDHQDMHLWNFIQSLLEDMHNERNS